MQYLRNNWESDFFGREIAYVTFNESEKITPIRYDLITSKVAADESEKIQALQQQGFVLVAGEAELQLNLATRYVQIKALDLEALFAQRQVNHQIARYSDLPELQQLFGSAFPLSRFSAPYFSIPEREQFYQHWAEQAVKGQFDDLCLIERKAGKLQGALTLKKQDQFTKIGLFAVAPNLTRQGVGKRLFEQAIAWAEKQETSVISVSTQLSNSTAIAFYQAQGAVLKKLYYWFYKRPNTT